MLEELNLEWSSMKSLRESTPPSKICLDKPTKRNPRLAKDTLYAKAVLDAWEEDVVKNEKMSTDTMGARLTYVRQSDNENLYGYIVVKENLTQKANIEKHSIPVVILFHTAAGPRDIFLKWKADLIAKDEIWGDNGCIVFIADILSDEEGWAWSHRDKYEQIKTSLLKRTIVDDDESPQRWKLRETIMAILTFLNTLYEVDCQRIGAMGWCLGGHSILELGRMNISGVRAMATFHGVFDTIQYVEEKNQYSKDVHKAKGVLICNGSADPFVSKQSLERSIHTIEANSWQVELMQFENVKHGFTNPAQVFNENEAFSFDKDGASLSWTAAMALLKKYLKH